MDEFSVGLIIHTKFSEFINLQSKTRDKRLYECLEDMKDSEINEGNRFRKQLNNLHASLNRHLKSKTHVK